MPEINCGEIKPFKNHPMFGIWKGEKPEDERLIPFKFGIGKALMIVEKFEDIKAFAEKHQGESNAQEQQE